MKINKSSTQKNRSARVREEQNGVWRRVSSQITMGSGIEGALWELSLEQSPHPAVGASRQSKQDSLLQACTARREQVGCRGGRTWA